MNEQYEKIVGQRIRIIREEKNMTQEQLAAKLQIMECNITRSALAKIEVGQRHLYVDEIAKIKSILNVSFEELLPSPQNLLDE